ncbi:MAG: hypothetical protein PVI50_05770 [Gammaproteobacteria bacterium]|jgi:hypothetical protein
MRNYTISLLCTLLCTAVVQADDKDKKTRYAAAPTEQPYWQQTRAAMPADEYRRSVHRNRDIVQQQLEVYSDRLLARAGEYGKAIDLFGAAVALAATDRRYHLNDSKTLGMVLQDTASSNRSLLLEYRMHW